MKIIYKYQVSIYILDQYKDVLANYAYTFDTEPSEDELIEKLEERKKYENNGGYRKRHYEIRIEKVGYYK